MELKSDSRLGYVGSMSREDILLLGEASSSCSGMTSALALYPCSYSLRLAKLKVDKRLDDQAASVSMAIRWRL